MTMPGSNGNQEHAVDQANYDDKAASEWEKLKKQQQEEEEAARKRSEQEKS